MYEELLEFAVRMAREAGKIHLAYFRSDKLAIRTKSNVYDVVTRADKESEELIAGMIAERYPDHAVLGEEGGSRGSAESDWRWVVDPLDGHDQLQPGIARLRGLYRPAAQGRDGRGRGLCPLSERVVHRRKRRRGFPAIRFAGTGTHPRRGKASACHVGNRHGIPLRQRRESGQQQRQRRPNHPLRAGRPATGIGGLRYQLCRGRAAGRLLELALHEWDVCAAELILREAGGVVCDLRRDRGISIVAGNAGIVEEMRKYVR